MQFIRSTARFKDYGIHVNSNLNNSGLSRPFQLVSARGIASKLFIGGKLKSIMACLFPLPNWLLPPTATLSHLPNLKPLSPTPPYNLHSSHKPQHQISSPLPLDDYEAVLGIEWLTTLGDVPWTFFKFIMKFFSRGKQVILREKRESNVKMVSMQRMEKLMIVWDCRIATHHCPDTAADTGLQEHGAPSIGTTRKPHEELQIKTRSLSLEDKADLKRTGLLGPQLSRVLVD
ncbi:hypothetical protein B296_00027092 [Ensete ventricosum]|uniref:Uncharacterized protein n=1 Tax=Ensete ventricosum TaxID=4639 RepID=A0A426ZW76_ENSVE|nr:hypothetical protein B296_00027092 [Ensete ventricosum]